MKIAGKMAARALASAMLTLAAPALARVENPAVVRVASDRVNLTWQAKGPIEIYVGDRADADIAAAKLALPHAAGGRADLAAEADVRRYFLLRDPADRSVVKVAERLVPLQQGSNFRDVGGYPAADGKKVRWGLIYRSGGTAMLTDADLRQVKALDLRNLVDLRSDEERVLAPTRIDGVPYSAIGYSMTTLLPSAASGAVPKNGGALYRNFPTMLAPHLRLVFAMLKRGEGPLEYNCSAGQDRTGFVTAMILSALGVPRETILRDYDLSTGYRQPRFEMPPINAAAHAGNPVAQMFAGFQNNPAAAVAQPLHDPDGRTFLASAFDEIDGKWGSVDRYLEQEIGLTPADVAALRQHYLE